MAIQSGVIQPNKSPCDSYNHLPLVAIQSGVIQPNKSPCDSYNHLPLVAIQSGVIQPNKSPCDSYNHLPLVAIQSGPYNRYNIIMTERSRVGTGMNRSARGWSVNWFERSTGLDTALYQSTPLPFYRPHAVKYSYFPYFFQQFLLTPIFWEIPILSYFCGFLDSPRAFLRRILKFLCAAHVFCRESAFRAPFYLNDLLKGKKLIIWSTGGWCMKMQINQKCVSR